MDTWWTYNGHIMDIDWACHAHTMDMYWTYNGHVIDMSWTKIWWACDGYMVDITSACKGHITDISWRHIGHILDIPWTCAGHAVRQTCTEAVLIWPCNIHEKWLLQSVWASISSVVETRPRVYIFCLDLWTCHGQDVPSSCISVTDQRLHQHANYRCNLSRQT